MSEIKPKGTKTEIKIPSLKRKPSKLDAINSIFLFGINTRFTFLYGKVFFYAQISLAPLVLDNTDQH